MSILVLAKAPVPGRVKTRLCPPCTPEQAARVAAAALEDTLDTVAATPAAGRFLVLDGHYPRAGWKIVRQRGGPLADRLAAAFADTRIPGIPSLLIGMDTPQVTPELLADALRRLGAPGGPDAVLGLAADGGWWALGLRDPRHAELLRNIATSTTTTGADTLTALHERGLRVATLPELRDVDTAADAHAVAATCDPSACFRQAVTTNVPEPRAASVLEPSAGDVPEPPAADVPEPSAADVPEPAAANGPVR